MTYDYDDIKSVEVVSVEVVIHLAREKYKFKTKQAYEIKKVIAEFQRLRPFLQ